MPASVIAHFDLDCFFVSVERCRNPDLVGVPVIVGGAADARGVVASCSYEARAKGVHSAMPVREALRKCPQAVLVQGSFREYDQYHFRVKAVAERFSPVVEMASIDEGYIDLSGTVRLQGHPLPAATRLRREIFSETGLDCTIGIASSKLVAKIATNFAKPGAVLYLLPEQETAFLSGLDVSDIPGVGPVLKRSLHRHHIRTISDLSAKSRDWLITTFGRVGAFLDAVARNDHRSALKTERVRKSIGKETTFSEDVLERDRIEAVIRQLVQKIGVRLRKKSLRARTITLKYRFSNFETHTSAHSFCQYTANPDRISTVAIDLLRDSWPSRRPLRLVGVSVSNFERATAQMELFCATRTEESRLHERDLACDRIRAKFGERSIQTGEGLQILPRHRG